MAWSQVQFLLVSMEEHRVEIFEKACSCLMAAHRVHGVQGLTWVRLGSLQEICDIGYSPHDIITTFFRVVKLSPELPEFLKLEFIRVRELASTTCDLASALRVMHLKAIVPYTHCLLWLSVWRKTTLSMWAVPAMCTYGCLKYQDHVFGSRLLAGWAVLAWKCR